jgi:hypothetical protein|tara:strand:- start:398 stop:940 length:543 start_codon:yes stop_codon:yes gene_type:complete
MSVVSDQKWIKNFSQFLVFSLLPLTGYLITSVISNNIALSLGMVGALSIVRFRTPVKNPSELVVYFILITLGIVIKVDGNLALNFVIFITLIVFFIEIYKYIALKLNFNEFFFSDESKHILKIHTKEENGEAINCKELTHSSYDGEYMYIFSTQNKARLQEIENIFLDDKIISKSIDIAE